MKIVSEKLVFFFKEICYVLKWPQLTAFTTITTVDNYQYMAVNNN